MDCVNVVDTVILKRENLAEPCFLEAENWGIFSEFYRSEILLSTTILFRSTSRS